jgi:FtsP/CotA-like multicopper oxidase with cupredoxin domain
MLRDVPFGNGVRLPTLQVSGQRYRFRVLNASQARVYLLALDNRASLSVIGNDCGLLPSATEVESVFLGVGERIDFLLDFSAFRAGARMMLKSLPFSLPSAPDDRYPQGMEMDLLELVRTGGGSAKDPPLPGMLSSVPRLAPAVAAGREFVFRSTDQENMHQINGRSFEMNRVDEQIPLGRVERWLFSNDSALPHPVHLHGTHFQVVSRRGGRNLVFPYEAGWKDTVLVMPLETVEVLVQFNKYRGIFLLHCHNLQHEDMGMMLNVEVT